MKCPNCGAEIASDAHFCQFCGAITAPQTPPQDPPQSQTPPPYTNPPQPNYVPPQPPYANQQQPPYYSQDPYAPNGAWQPGVPVPPGYQRKSKIAAGLLGIFLGSLGIHNFYLGYTNKALIQLLVTLLTCGIGGFFMGIWGLVEGIQILVGSINVDAKGIPLSD